MTDRDERPASKANTLASGPRGEERLYGIGELAAELGISTRTVRFYETKGLLKPRRAGVNRIYDKRDRARLLLILRGKRLGFSLDEIAEYLDLYDADPGHVIQVRHLLRKVEQAISGLEAKRADIESTLQELADIRSACVRRLQDKR